MSFNLNDFRNKFAGGGARPSQFEMQITWPDVVRGTAGVAAAEQDFRFLCKASELPGEKHGVISVPYFGRKLKYVGDREFDPLTITVLNDEDFKVRKALEAWIVALTARDTTVSQFSGGIQAGSYVTDGIITQMSRNAGGGPTKAYKFVGMWPTDLSNIQLNWETNDTVEEFTCQFAYQWWEPVDPTTGATL